ncbi:TrmB family transcriptional regulator [Halomicroarcula sp. F13]|uniref:TrmB family transcriptional regulator n=1 Tax=Haloarcula rubra TaxID=2487747 RepID=A0AAW4PWQ3_9EURY|nr:TrmB family transcriptional regulator [Halomicroarcula rubra]MBX0325611.1 TrmB family transcriptional regulator [Halomicroarcula rubra]
MTAEDDAKLALLRETLEDNVDLTTYETEVYLALVRGGTQTMTDISETSDVPKQRVYDIVDGLRERGFVEVIDDYPRKAYAVDPSEALSSIRDQISRAEEYLEELHDTVETVESGVALFKSESTIKRYVSDLLQTADHDILLLLPIDRLPAVVEDLEQCTDQQIRLIVSNVSPEATDDEMQGLGKRLPETVDEVRTVTSKEDFALTVDRSRGLYWAQTGHKYLNDEEHGYYVTNPSLAMVLDRFVSESVWPVAKPVVGGSTQPTLPRQYMRIRDCLADLATLTDSRPVDAFEISFEGYDTETGEDVSKRGTLTSYYYTEYDVRASLTLDIEAPTEHVESSLVTVGGVGTRNVDYAAHSIELRENVTTHSDHLDDETKRHLEACQAELPAEFGNESVVIGLDAFVDRMRELVERPPGEEYQRIRQFDAFREALVRFEASEMAPRIQWRQIRTEPGGHVAHVGGVFDDLGYDLTLLGPLGDPVRSEFASRFRNHKLVSIGQTTSTDFVWFEDRKFLLTEPNLESIDWERVTERIELSVLAEYVDGSALLTLGSWYATPNLPDILDGLREDLWPLLSSPPDHVHFSPGEISQFSRTEIEHGRDSISALDDVVPVTVTANRSQTRRFRDTLLRGDDETTTPTVERVRNQLGVTRYAMHSQRGAIMASQDDVRSARAPQIVNPRQIRNVDEHFNSGLALALSENLSDGAALVLANAVASYFMRHKKPPKSAELRDLVGEYDAFFAE